MTWSEWLVGRVSKLLEMMEYIQYVYIYVYIHNYIHTIYIQYG